MGNAVCRFREMAFAIRCRADAAFISPVHLFAGPGYAMRSLDRRLLAGDVPAKEFADILADITQGIDEKPSPLETLSDERNDANRWFAQYRQPLLKHAPSEKAFADQHAAAITEAKAWGNCLPLMEQHLAELAAATQQMRTMATDAWLARYSQTKQLYAQTLLAWQRAWESLAPYEGEPSALKDTRSAGRPKNSEELARRLLNGWDKYEPRQGRRTKVDFLSQLPEVIDLKSESAKQRKIDSLRTTLDSALHLRREKRQRLRNARRK